jgi:hypothetical protein
VLEDAKLLKRFEAKFTKTDGCWNWNKGHAFTGNGYGMIYYKSGMRTAHRIAYQLYKGDIPNGSWVLHTCDNRSCVNPNHLYLGDRKQNVKDMLDRGRLADTSGENNGRSKLTLNEIDEIKYLHSKRFTCRGIANMYGVSHQLISRICRGEIWISKQKEK